MFSAHIIDRYSGRPTELHDVCLAELAMWYAVHHITKSIANGGEPDQLDELTASDHEEVNNRQEDVNIISIKGHGKMKKRVSPAVIRYH